jgi:hypothetical protein
LAFGVCNLRSSRESGFAYICSSNTEVTASKEEVAEAQMKSEVKQRLLGFLPNYYFMYFKDPAPLNESQKMRLAFRLSVDPVTFGIAAVQAANETNSKNYAPYEPERRVLLKRCAAAYADGLIATIIGSGLLHAAAAMEMPNCQGRTEEYGIGAN